MEQARQNLEAQVLERAARDPRFREELKQDPRGTLSRDFGVQVPPGMTVEVLEETSSTVFLVLPAAPTQPGQELTGQELETVAGGWSGDTGCGTCGQQSCNSCMSCNVVC